MRRCIALALQAREQGNTPVGALITLDDNIIAKASEQLPAAINVTGHAEIIAIQDACHIRQTMDLSTCTMYTTAEPCWMCSYVIRETKIARVVIGSRTEDVGGISTKYPLLIDESIANWGTPPEVIMGILEDECLQLRQ